MNLFKPIAYTIRKIHTILSRALGGEVEVVIPPELRPYAHSGEWEVLPLLTKLQKKGLLAKFVHRKTFPDEPRTYIYDAYSREGVSGHGIHATNPVPAMWRALGEMIERTLWHHHDIAKNGRRCSAAELGSAAVNIFSFAGFTEAQRKQHVALQYNEHTPFTWVRGRSIVTNKLLWCPAQIVSALHSRRARGGNETSQQGSKNPYQEPMIRWSITTGLGTGRSLRDAIVSGMLEVIERDAFMITYLNRISPDHIPLTELEKEDAFKEVLSQCKRYRIEPHVLLLPTDFPISICLVVLEDKTGEGPAITVGASADFELYTAVQDALSEALIVRAALRNTANTRENPWRTHEKPIQLDRTERLFYWAQEHQLGKLDFLYSGSAAQLPPRVPSNKNHTKNRYSYAQFATLVRACRALKEEAFYVDLSSENTRSLGFHSVHVVMPGLQPMHLDEQIPYLGGHRLSTVPQKLGYTHATTLNSEPHPFP